MSEQKVLTVAGRFSKGIITDNTGNKIECMTYQKDKAPMESKEGYFNLRWSIPLECWVLFQYVLIE
jgi:hypothetical protein